MLVAATLYNSIYFSDLLAVGILPVWVHPRKPLVRPVSVHTPQVKNL